MSCIYTIDGKTYTAWEFDDFLRSMPVTEATKYMPAILSEKGRAAEVDRVKRSPAIRQTETPEFKKWFGKSAIGNNGQFDGENPDIRRSPSSRFYSQLARSFEQAPDKVFGPAKQVKAWLTSNAAKLQIKQDEIQWTGINEYLDLQTRVSKADVLSYLAQNGVQIEEVEKGKAGFDEDNPQLPAGWTVAPTEDRRAYLVKNSDGRNVGKGPTREDAIFDAHSGYPEAWDGGDATKYSSYTLPGGENYRELLLTLPDMVEARKKPIRDQIAALEAPYFESGAATLPPDVLAQRRELRDQLNAIGKSTAGYRSTHWDEKNILAHIRVNDRTDADGNKVLFVEEAQSDWGQDGKKNGFMGKPPASNKPTLEERDALLREMRQKAKAEIIKRTNGGIDEDTAGEVVRKQPLSQVAEWAGLSTEWESLLKREAEWDAFDRSPPIPKAPFVTSTEGWLDLSLKRIAAYAVENGYDKVAFVNGEQSAERYDLSKKISRIVLHDNSTGGVGKPRLEGEFSGGNLTAYGTEGQMVIDGRYVQTESELEDNIGKEAAAKLLAAKASEARVAGIGMRSRELSGLDLKVGGEGMTAFYDQILPQRLRTLLKKLGGKAETVQIEGELTQDQKQQFNRAYGTGTVEDIAAANQLKKPMLDQLGFSITPEMRETVGAGQPLFSPAGRDGKATDAEKWDAVRTLWQQMAEQEDVFQFPKSEGKTMEEIFKDIAPEFRVSKRVPDEKLANKWVIFLPNRKDVEVKLLKTGRMFVDASQLKSGASFGSTIYAGLLNFAHNNDYVFVGDPAGVSGIATFRRTENMLSAALKFGTTAFMEPSYSQRSPKETAAAFVSGATVMKQLKPVAWEAGNDQKNLAALMQASYANVKHFVPEIENVYYDPDAKDFKWSNTDRLVTGPEWEVLSRQLLSGLGGVRDGGNGLEGVGARGPGEAERSATLKRSAITSTVLREESREGLRSVLDRIGSELHGAVQLNRVLYSPAQRNLAGMPIASAWNEASLPDANALRERFIYEIQDKFVDLKRARDAIKDAGIQIRDEFDPYLVEETYHGAAAYKVQTALEQEFLPVLEEMKMRGIKLEEFDKFLHARHAPERNAKMAERNPNQAQLDQMISDLADLVFSTQDQVEAAKLETKLRHLRNTKPYSGTEAERNALSGMSDADAAAYLASLGARRRTFDALGLKIDEITAENRRLMGAYGLETGDTVRALEGLYQHYVSLMRELDESDLLGTGGTGTGAGYSVRGSTLKEATGSLRSVEAILANLVAQREQIIVRGEKAKVGRALYALALTAPNPDFWSVIVPGKMTAGQIKAALQQANIDPVLLENMTEAPVEQYVDENTGLVRSRVNPLLYRDPNAIVVRINGEDRVILFNRQNDRATRLAQALRNDDMGRSKSPIAQVINDKVGFATRWISSVNTQYNPVFGLKNFVRDIQGAALNASTTGIFDRKSAMIKQVPKALRAIWQQERGSRHTDPVWSALWGQFREDGAMTGYRDQFNGLEDRVKAIEKTLKGNKFLDKTGLGYLLQMLSDYNTAIENGVRLAAYKEALGKGMSRPQAASLAKNLTVNFNRKGRTGTAASRYYAFFNAAVQGNARIIETAQGGHKGKAAVQYASKFLGGGVSLGFAYTLIALMFMGDDWEDIPEYSRERELIIPDPFGLLGDSENVGATKGGYKYLRVPMALGFHAIPNVGRNMAEILWFGDDVGSRASNAVGALLEAMNPIGGGFSWDKGVGGVLELIAPSVIDPFIQLANNQNAFGRPIAKQSFSDKDPTPAPDRFFRSASTPGKLISLALDRVTGGDGIDSGAVQVTPDQFDFAFGQVTGGVGRESLKVWQYLESKVTGDKIPESRTPVVGMFYGVTKSEQAMTGRFFEIEKKVNIARKQLEAKNSPTSRQEFLNDSPEARIAGEMKSALTRLRRLQKARKMADERGAKDEVKRLDGLINEVRIGVVERYNDERERD